MVQAPTKHYIPPHIQFDHWIIRPDIREVAREHDVPLMEDPPLTRALYRAVKVGQAVPEKFYQAVATVLSHVYRLHGRTA